MSGDPLAAKRPVTPWLAGPYGHPFHPILVTVPIGAWVASLVFDVAGYLVRRPEGLVEGARWLVALGVLGAVLAAAAGLLDLLVIPPGTPAFRVALMHLTLNVLVTAAYAVSLALRLGQAGRPGPVAAGLVGLSVLALAGLAVSGWLGGRLAYHYGVRVADEATQARGFVRTRG